MRRRQSVGLLRGMPNAEMNVLEGGEYRPINATPRHVLSAEHCRREPSAQKHNFACERNPMLSHNARGTQLLCRAAEKEASTRFLMLSRKNSTPLEENFHAHGGITPPFGDETPRRGVSSPRRGKILATENTETLHVTDFTHGREQPRGTAEGGQSPSPGARGTLKRRVFSGLRFAVSPFCRTFALTL